MNREVIETPDETTWLAARKQDVTSTESSALFGENPWLTPFGLWHMKHGMEDHVEVTERMELGLAFESAIAEVIAKRRNWTIKPMKQYIRLPEARMGSSFDFEIEATDERGPGILEIKLVDLFAFRNGWLVDEENVEAPARIEIQLQHQFHVSGHQWGAIGALIGGNRIEIIDRVAYPDVGESLERKIREFWSLTDAPAPDYTVDAATVRRLYSSVSEDRSVDLTTDDMLTHLCTLYDTLGSQIKDLGKQRDAAQANILTIVRDAKNVRANGYKISSWVVGAAHIEYDRDPFRSMRITKQKEK